MNIKKVSKLSIISIVLISNPSIYASDLKKLETVKAPSSVIPVRRDFPLNDKLNPCDDFHKYVCSNVESSFKLREDRSRHVFAFSDSDERILEFKKNFFKNLPKEKKLDQQGQQLKDYYMACMNKNEGIKQEKEYISKIIAAVNKIKTPHDFINYNIQNVVSGNDSLFHFGGTANKDNPKIYDIFIGSNLMNLPEHSYYEDKVLMNDYKKLIIDFFRIIEPKKKDAEYNNIADSIIQIEQDFVKIYPKPAVRRQRWSEKRQETQEAMIKKYSNLGLAELFKVTPSNLFVANQIPEGLDFLNSKITNENLQAFKDYYLYSFLSDVLDDSNPAYFKKQFDFSNKYLGGPVKRSERNERCTRSTMYSFMLELDSLLVPRMFPNFPEEKVKEVASKIRESIISGISKNSWLSASAKEKAIAKIKLAKLYLIQPQNEKEWDFKPVKKYSSTKRLDNRLLLRKTMMDKELEDLKHEVNHEAWGMGPLIVNAYYDPSANKFVLPIGILQYPFFDANGSIVDNLGAVGTVFAHELGHGVDDQGSKYDENGKLNQWMSMNDLKEFSNRSKKLIDQFNKAGHNGSLTLGENVADLVGLTFAYNAAFPEGKGAIEDKKKLFIAYARLWCNVTRPKQEENQLKTDPHALGWARINEQVKQQKGFAEAFQCKAGDKMTLPENEMVHIW